MIALYTADLLDLQLCDRLFVGNDRQSLQKYVRE